MKTDICSEADSCRTSIHFLVRYVGSFIVNGDCQQTRFNSVRIHLEVMRTVLHNSKPVMLNVSSNGVQICSMDGQIVHMAHALKRVSYATCDPDSRQFAFAARQPSAKGLLSKEPTSTAVAIENVDDTHIIRKPFPAPGVQYCHVFRTDSPEQAQEINDVISSTFRRAAQTQEKPRVKKDINTGPRCQKVASDASASSSSDSSTVSRVSSKSPRGVSAEMVYESEPRKLEPRRTTTSYLNAINSEKANANPFSHEISPRVFSNAECHLVNGAPETVLKTVAKEQQNMDDEEKAVLRQRSTRQKRRPLSAAFANFGHHKKRPDAPTSTPIAATQSNQDRRASLFDSGGENGKTASIFKRLLNMKLGGGSSLRLNVLNSNMSTPLPESSQHRARPTSHSVRVLGSNLDHASQGGESHTAADPSTFQGNAMTKRKHRPLSAVFATSSSGSCKTEKCTQPNGVCNQPSNSTAETPGCSQKISSSKSAVGKMFGLSSTRRKSRSSAQLDKATRHQIACNALAEERNDERPRVPLENPRFTPHFEKLVPGGNACSPLLGSGVGCGDHCSMSMPNLRCNSEMPVPLNDQEEAKLNKAAWFCRTMPRNIVAYVLQREPEGAFLVRRSISHPEACLVLSVRVPCNSRNPCGVAHYLILHTLRGFKLKGEAKEFDSIHALVTHHSFMQEQLPCRLVFTQRDVDLWTKALVETEDIRKQNAFYPFSHNRGDLASVTEEECIYGKLQTPNTSVGGQKTPGSNAVC